MELKRILSIVVQGKGRKHIDWRTVGGKKKIVAADKMEERKAIMRCLCLPHDYEVSSHVDSQ